MRLYEFTDDKTYTAAINDAAQLSDMIPRMSPTDDLGARLGHTRAADYQDWLHLYVGR